jgi:hypothetical protein
MTALGFHFHVKVCQTAEAKPWNIKHKLLIVITLNLFSGAAFAQSIQNEKLYSQLICGFLKESHESFSSSTGLVTHEIDTCLKIDSLAKRFLVISIPKWTITRISKTHVSRLLLVQVEMRDSLSGIMKELTHCDTIPIKNLRTVRKTEHGLLRTEDPRFLQRAALPFLLVFAGVAGIITLFYLRS